MPVQVDGEAWIQPPGYIRIVHKNRAQTLTRDRVRAAARGAGGWGYQWLAHGLPCTFIRGKDASCFVGGFLFTIQRLVDVVVCPIGSVIQRQEASQGYIVRQVSQDTKMKLTSLP